MTLTVNLEHLATSAARTTGHGEDLATSHLSADNRIAAAQGGWTGRSAEALARRARAMDRQLDGTGDADGRSCRAFLHLRPGIRDDGNSPR